MSENNRGDLLIGSGVVAKGTMTAPGLIEVDGTVDGILRAKAQYSCRGAAHGQKHCAPIVTRRSYRADIGRYRLWRPGDT